MTQAGRVNETDSAELRAEIAAGPGHDGPAAGRTVAEFDGRRLFELRRARWLMQDALGKLAGVSRGEIGHLERTPPGPRTQASDRKPTLRTLVRLAAALGVDPSDLLALPDRQDLPPKDLLALRDEQARAHEEIADERELA